MTSLLQGNIVPPQPTASDSTTSQPLWAQDMSYNLANQASNWASTTADPYASLPAPLVAAQSGATQQAIGMGMNDTGVWQPDVSAATQYTQNAAQPVSNNATNYYGSNYAPNVTGMGQQIGTSYNQSALGGTQAYTGALNSNIQSQIGNYENPYNQQVVGGIESALDTNLTQNVMPQIYSNFVSAGQAASPQEMQAANNAIYQNQQAVGQAVAPALEQGYNTALSAAQSAANTGLNAGMTGANTGYSLANTGYSGALSTALSQQQMQQTAGAQMGQLGALTQQETAADIGQVAAAGQTEDLYNQNVDNAANSNYLSQSQWPITATGYEANILNGIPMSTTTDNTAVMYQPSSTYTASPLQTFAGTALVGSSLGSSSTLARGGRVRRYAKGGSVAPLNRFAQGGTTDDDDDDDSANVASASSSPSAQSGSDNPSPIAMAALTGSSGSQRDANGLTQLSPLSPWSGNTFGMPSDAAPEYQRLQQNSAMATANKSQRIQDAINILNAGRVGGANLPMMAAGAAMLAPTHTGQFSESLGNAFKAAIPVIQQQRQQDQAYATALGNLGISQADLDTVASQQEQGDFASRMRYYENQQNQQQTQANTVAARAQKAAEDAETARAHRATEATQATQANALSGYYGALGESALAPDAKDIQEVAGSRKTLPDGTQTAQYLDTSDPDAQPFTRPVTVGVSSTGKEGQTERLVDQLIAEGSATNRADALAKIHDPSGKNAAQVQAATARLASADANRNPNYLKDPMGTLNLYRQSYGLPALKTVPAPGAAPTAPAPTTSNVKPGAPPVQSVLFGDQ